jgi:hypothetical protein
MSLDNLDVVDAIGTEIESKVVVLTIIDAWDWRDRRIHLAALQDKINKYFEFIESGQIYASYPGATGKALRIDIVSKFAPPEVALKFLEKASAVAAQLNLTVTLRVH